MVSHTTIRHLIVGSLINVAVFTAMPSAFAGGIALGGTRLIYPEGTSQVSLSVTNSDSKNVFLIQSWVANADGTKSSDFILTPPLFVIKSGKENTLRIMYTGQAPLPQDRELVYYLNSKAIPSGAPLPGQNTLQIATQTVIKLFMRPANLPSSSNAAPDTLRCHLADNNLTLNNPSPYYVSLVNFTVGGQAVRNIMVPPKSSTQVTVPGGHGGAVIFQTINDYGVSSAKKQCVMQ